ncbi:unnamed protein product [Caenorhabditis sp. 36 PRJEB53466]|nr:unnamed protein product [Caenorhabditis sp. 36 PRJEB53466]
MKLCEFLLLATIFAASSTAGAATTRSWLAERKYTVPETPENCEQCKTIVRGAKGPWSREELYQKQYMRTIAYFLSGAQTACGHKDCRRLIGQIAHIYRINPKLSNATETELCVAAKVCSPTVLSSK